MSLHNISAQHTQAIITSFYGDDHLELNAVFTFPRVPRTSEYSGLCFAWLLADLLLRAGVLAPPEALNADAVCGDARWDGLAALYMEPSPQREAARATVRAVTWWWILYRK